MAGATDAFSRDVLQLYFGKSGPFSAYSPIFVGLFVGDPDSGGTEVSGGAYARVSTVAADWNDATVADPSVTDNVNLITFPQASADWESQSNLTHFALFDALSGGTHDISGTITVPKPVLQDDIAQFAVGALSITLT